MGEVKYCFANNEVLTFEMGKPKIGRTEKRTRYKKPRINGEEVDVEEVDETYNSWGGINRFVQDLQNKEQLSGQIFFVPYGPFEVRKKHYLIVKVGKKIGVACKLIKQKNGKPVKELAKEMIKKYRLAPYSSLSER